MLGFEDLFDQDMPKKVSSNKRYLIKFETQTV